MANGPDPGAELRSRIEEPEIAVMPGVYDALSGLLAEQAGFGTVFTSGFVSPRHGSESRIWGC